MINLKSYKDAYDLRQEGLGNRDIGLKLGMAMQTAKAKANKYEKMIKKDLFFLIGKVDSRGIIFLECQGATNWGECVSVIELIDNESHGNVGIKTIKELKAFFKVKIAPPKILLERERLLKRLSEVDAIIGGYED